MLNVLSRRILRAMALPHYEPLPYLDATFLALETRELSLASRLLSDVIRPFNMTASTSPGPNSPCISWGRG